MKMKLLGLTLFLVFFIKADYLTKCLTDCNNGNFHEQLDKQNCIGACYIISARS